MDRIFICMENLFIHLAPFPRRMPSGIPVDSVGYISRKNDWMRRTFTTFNFSLILSGEGSYTFRGETTQFQAPAVITQWPGEHVEYGPTGESGAWEELYFIYAPETLPELTRRNLALDRKPFWCVRRTTTMQEHASHLLEILWGARRTVDPDRIDRACEALIVETRLGESRPPVDRDEAVIRTIRDQVRSHCLENHNFDELARKHGMSPSTFRRQWARFVHAPPARYAMTIRMREACRMLVETHLTVAEIAHDLNFCDPLYFSRRFKEIVGVPATAYRATHEAQPWA